MRTEGQSSPGDTRVTTARQRVRTVAPARHTQPRTRTADALCRSLNANRSRRPPRANVPCPGDRPRTRSKRPKSRSEAHHHAVTIRTRDIDGTQSHPTAFRLGIAAGFTNEPLDDGKVAALTCVQEGRHAILLTTSPVAITRA
jgi:hypothetical protein